MDQVEVKILDRIFKLQVPPSEKPRLMEAVRIVDAKMREIRDTGKASGLDRIAVNAALRIAFEFLGQEDRRRPAVSPQITNELTRMSDAIDDELRRQENLF
jgi:cell division protein ZapA